ncbi:hypothetical protein HYPSUDRAFT_52705 [Hypholoma sublateritium FD-334 SS-4]|uniref:Copper transport protein n=1 Tax=Hypholoma sublateritium (strain FD-334 SS-4) TaxID=945553 RepID=A0A0D2MPQ2_HYPSF|nr:hypothetical protein HYPSUDRAFT_52705 [Hypholoma sublateritium FD-334 SS-4]
MPAAHCKMNMLWNTDILNTCIVFRGWHITSPAGFVLSCAAVAALSILYELLRVAQRALDQRIARALALSPAAAGDVKATDGGSESPTGSRVSLVAPTSESGLLPRHMLARAPRTGTPVPAAARAMRALVYGATVFFSFFLMLVFMTYNAYLIASVVVGATIGNYIFSSTMSIDSVLGSTAGSGLACH